MKDHGMNDIAKMGRTGFSGSSLLLMFLGGALTGAAVAYLSQSENRATVRAVAVRAQQTASHLPGAMRDASHAAKEAFHEAYNHGDSGSQMLPKQEH